MEAIPEKAAKGKEKTQPELNQSEPVQMEMDFSEKHRKVVKKEMEKDLEKLMVMLDKWAVPVSAVNEIISIVYASSLRLVAVREVK